MNHPTLLEIVRKICRVLSICLIFEDIVHLRPWDAGQLGLGHVGCRKRRMQEKKDAGKEGCRKRRMEEKKDE